jgi:hypothetical protein
LKRFKVNVFASIRERTLKVYLSVFKDTKSANLSIVKNLSKNS